MLLPNGPSRASKGPDPCLRRGNQGSNPLNKSKNKGPESCLRKGPIGRKVVKIKEINLTDDD